MISIVSEAYLNLAGEALRLFFFAIEPDLPVLFDERELECEELANIKRIITRLPPYTI